MGIAMNFARNLRKLMQDRGLNPNSASAKWHVSQRTLADVSGTEPANPRLSTVEAIAKGAGVPVTALLSEDMDLGEAALVGRYHSLSPPERIAFLRGLGLSQPEQQSAPPPEPQKPNKPPRAASGEVPARRRKSVRAAA